MYKKKATPGTVQFNKLISKLSEKKTQENTKAQVQFRHGLLEPQEIINYKNEFDRLQGATKTARIGYQYKIKNARTSNKNETITERRTTSSYLFY